MQLTAVLAVAVLCVLHQVNAGGAPYGGAPYGGAPYGGATYGGAPYGGAPYGGAPYGGYNGVDVYPVYQGGYYQEPVIQIEPVPVEYIDVPVEVPVQVPYEIGYPVPVPTDPYGWTLGNSEVLTGGSASAKHNIVSGGSTSADGAVFTNSKTRSRTRQNTEIKFGMLGGDGGENTNSQKSGIEHNGGGIVNFLSKVQGQNNQGVNGGSELVNLLRRVYGNGLVGGYSAPVIVDGGYQAPVIVDGGYQAPVVVDGGYQAPVVVDGGYQTPVVVDGGYQAPVVVQGGYQAPVVVDGSYVPVING